MCTENCKSWFHIIQSCNGIIIGLCAFIAFFCFYENVDAGFWAFLSALFAAVCFQLHYLHIRQKLNSWHSVETLNGVKVLAVMGALAGIAATVWYIFIALYHDVPVLPIQPSMYIAAVWTFATAVWGMMLFAYCNKYIRILQDDDHALISI